MPAGDGVLLGRTPETTLLHAAADDARAGNPAVVLIAGAAGIGKTRLLSAAMQQWERDGALVLSGGGVAIPGLENLQTPYGPFAEALRALGDVPGVRSWLDGSGAPESRLDPAQHRRAELLDLLGAVGADRLVVLVIDDLHWADQSSLELLVFLVRNVRWQKLLIVGATRPFDPRSLTPTAAAFDHLRRLPRVQWVELSGLSDADISELARQNGATREARNADIVRVADGHPLFAVELARSPEGQRVPRTIASSLARRMAPAAAATRHFTAAVAVAGGEVGHDELAAILERAGAPLHQAVVQEAVERELLEVTADGYRFHHALEREAVYESLLPGERHDLHCAAARGLAGMPAVGTAAATAERAARIASHWTMAGDPGEIAASSAAAAHASAAVGAFPEALAHARRALAAQPSPALTLEAAVFARWAGAPADGVALVEHGIATATEPRDLALLWERLGWLRREIGEGDAAAAAYRRAAELVEQVDDPAVASRVHAGHAAFLMTRYRLVEAQREAQAALDLVGAEVSATRANALNTLGVALAMTGDEDAGLALLTESRDVSLAANSEEDVWRYVGNATFVLQNLGRTAEALDIAMAARARAARGGVSRSLAALPVITNAVSASILLGRWRDAMEMIDDALRGDPPPAHEAHLRLYAATVHQLRGEDDDAEHQVRTARHVGATTKDPAIGARADAIEADLAANRQQFEVARGLLRRALEHVRGTDDAESALELVGLGLRIEADAAQVSQRDPAAQTQLAEQLEAIVAELKDDPRADLQLALEAAQAERERIDERDPAARWHEIATGWAAVEQPHPAAYAFLRAAEAALANRDRRGARRDWQRGCVIAQSLDPSRVLADLQALGRRARLEPPSPADSIPSANDGGLTRREREVVQLLVDGLSNRQIASRLGMSEKTASVHVSNLMAKLGVTSRSRAAAVAVQRGLVA